MRYFYSDDGDGIDEPESFEVEKEIFDSHSWNLSQIDGHSKYYTCPCGATMGRHQRGYFGSDVEGLKNGEPVSFIGSDKKCTLTPEEITVAEIII